MLTRHKIELQAAAFVLAVTCAAPASAAIVEITLGDFTDPQVLAVMAAPPTYANIGQNVDGSGTTFGRTSETENETNTAYGLVAGVSFGVGEEFSVLGKKVFELRPNMDWDKGKAVLWLLDALGLDTAEVVPIYIGDDVTDRDAFDALRGRGLSLLVAEEPQATSADYRLYDVAEVRRFLNELTAVLGGKEA